MLDWEAEHAAHSNQAVTHAIEFAPYPALAARHTFTVRSDERCLPDIRGLQLRLHETAEAANLTAEGVKASYVLRDVPQW
jgi:hypothetical protein